jgi:hypothetical protein
MNDLIPAYVPNWKPYLGNLETYKAKTVIAKDADSVVQKITEYINKYLPCDEVKSFLNQFLGDKNLLQKTQIVWDGSGRLVCFLVRPNFYCSSGDYYGNKIDDLSVLKEKAETIFLNLAGYEEEDDFIYFCIDFIDFFIDFMDGIEQKRGFPAADIKRRDGG